MSIYLLDNKLWFPPVEEAEPDGLLAVGGTLSTARLLLAYSKGIFPWYSDDEPILWYCTQPRFVLFPNELKISKSMQKICDKNVFTCTFNTCFEDVITNCKTQKRMNQDGTWINNDIIKAYTILHKKGFAKSVECWQNNKLVGGLYGVQFGKVFFGESMFATVSNASKFAFIQLVKQLQLEGIELIDCQQETTHLASLGARLISLKEFKNYL